MDFNEVAAAVMLGILGAASVIASVARSLKQPYSEVSWLTIGGILLPIAFLMMAMITAERLPPFLGG